MNQSPEPRTSTGLEVLGDQIAAILRERGVAPILRSGLDLIDGGSSLGSAS